MYSFLTTINKLENIRSHKTEEKKKTQQVQPNFRKRQNILKIVPRP